MSEQRFMPNKRFMPNIRRVVREAAKIGVTGLAVASLHNAEAGTLNFSADPGLGVEAQTPEQLAQAEMSRKISEKFTASGYVLDELIKERLAQNPRFKNPNNDDKRAIVELAYRELSDEEIINATPQQVRMLLNEAFFAWQANSVQITQEYLQAVQAAHPPDSPLASDFVPNKPIIGSSEPSVYQDNPLRPMPSLNIDPQADEEPDTGR